MAGIKVLNGGMLTTVQDLGRQGYSAYGVSPGGAMDIWAMTVANRLVGNRDQTGGLEVTATGFKVEWMEDGIFSITGGDPGATLNDSPLKPWCAYSARKGDQLTFVKGKWGLRSYLAVRGGFDLPLVMGSQSTDIKGKFGGFQGRKLEKGDILTIGQRTAEGISPIIERELPGHLRGYVDFETLRVIPGPHEDRFSEAGRKDFFKGPFHVGQAFDRMGCRLEGSPIDPGDRADILSDGMMFGAVQVPGDGVPIIMGADRQTTGGYRKIAHVISSDLGKLAQKTWKDPVRFRKITLDEAYRELKEREKEWKNWAATVKEASGPKKEDSVTPVENQVEDQPIDQMTNQREIQTQNQLKEQGRYFQVTVNGKRYNVKVEES